MTTRTRTAIIVLPILFLTAGAPAASSPETRETFPNRSVELVAKVVSQKYCTPGRAGLPELRFTLTVQVRNLMRVPITLDHFAISDGVYIAKTVRDLHSGKYEPGSRLPDTAGLSRPATKWQAEDKTLGPGKILKSSTTSIWILVATDESQRQLGASPGKHYLQIFGEVELSDRSHNPATVILSSLPVPFAVARHPELQACD